MKKACFGRPGRVCARFEYASHGSSTHRIVTYDLRTHRLNAAARTDKIQYRTDRRNTPPQRSSAAAIEEHTASTQQRGRTKVAFPPSRTLSEGCGTTGDTDWLSPGYRGGRPPVSSRSHSASVTFPRRGSLRFHLRQRFLGNS